MKVLSRLLLGLGTFLGMLAVLASTWVPGVIKRIPLDINTTTIYTGEAAKLDPTSGAFVTKPVYALTRTKVDSQRSSSGHVLMVVTTCAVFDTGGAKVCVNGNDPDLIAANMGVFALDRVSAEGVDDDDLPNDALHPRGLVNKFPFDAEKKTYPFWDNALGRAVDMKFIGTKRLDGLETYEYSYSVQDEPVQVAPGVEGMYDNTVIVNVDPSTGSIVRSGQDQQRYLDDGTPILDITLVTDDSTVASAVDEAKRNGRTLTILLRVIPLVGIVGGVLCLLAGTVVLRKRHHLDRG